MSSPPQPATWQTAVESEPHASSADSSIPVALEADAAP